MLYRRLVLGTIASTAMLASISLAHAQVAPDAAKAFVQQTGQALTAVVNGSASASQKANQLRQLVDQDVAVDQVGEYILGRFAGVATPAQHAQYLALFHQTLSYSITNQIRAFQGITFTVNGSSPMGNDTVVDTTITRPGQPAADVGWAVDQVNGTPKIVDVIVAGTSLRITTRNDYASVITSNGGQVSALLAAMQSQIDRIKSAQ